MCTLVPALQHCPCTRRAHTTTRARCPPQVLNAHLPERSYWRMVVASAAVTQQLCTVVASVAVPVHLYEGNITTQQLLGVCAALLVMGEASCGARTQPARSTARHSAAQRAPWLLQRPGAEATAHPRLPRAALQAMPRAHFLATTCWAAPWCGMRHAACIAQPHAPAHTCAATPRTPHPPTHPPTPTHARTRPRPPAHPPRRGVACGRVCCSWAACTCCRRSSRYCHVLMLNMSRIFIAKP